MLYRKNLDRVAVVVRRAPGHRIHELYFRIRGLSLSTDQLKTLDEASRIELGFPHDLYPKSRAITYGGMRDQILA